MSSSRDETPLADRLSGCKNVKGLSGNFCMGSRSDDLRPTKQQVVSWCISFRLSNDASRKEPFKLLGRTNLPIEILVIVEIIKITREGVAGNVTANFFV